SRHYFVRPDDNKEVVAPLLCATRRQQGVVAPLLCATRRQQGGRRATTLCDPTTTRRSSRHYFVRPDDNKGVVAPLLRATRRQQGGHRATTGSDPTPATGPVPDRPATDKVA